MRYYTGIIHGPARRYTSSLSTLDEWLLGVGLCWHNFEHNGCVYAFENYASIIGINWHNFGNFRAHNRPLSQRLDYIFNMDW